MSSLRSKDRLPKEKAGGLDTGFERGLREALDFFTGEGWLRFVFERPERLADNGFDRELVFGTVCLPSMNDCSNYSTGSEARLLLSSTNKVTSQVSGSRPRVTRVARNASGGRWLREKYCT